MSREIFALKGTICYSASPTELSITEGGYVVCENGHCAGVFPELPDRYRQIPCTDFGDELIIPGPDRSAHSRSPVHIPGIWHGSGTAGLAEYHHLSPGSPL